MIQTLYGQSFSDLWGAKLEPFITVLFSELPVTVLFVPQQS